MTTMKVLNILILVSIEAWLTFVSVCVCALFSNKMFWKFFWLNFFYSKQKKLKRFSRFLIFSWFRHYSLSLSLFCYRFSGFATKKNVIKIKKKFANLTWSCLSPSQNGIIKIIIKTRGQQKKSFRWKTKKSLKRNSKEYIRPQAESFNSQHHHL